MSKDTPTLFVLNGPNLNLLGLHQPEVNGVDTLDDIEAACRDHAAALGVEIDFRQTNHEGELVSWVQEARSEAGALLINAAAYAYTSIALQDALRMLEIPVAEVQIGRTHKQSLVAEVAQGVISGFGLNSYLLGLDGLARILGKE